MNNCYYLKVTIHDNDFTSDYQILGNLIKDILWINGYYPEYDSINHNFIEGKNLTEEDLPIIKRYIGDAWCMIHNFNNYLRWGKDIEDTERNYFNCELTLVDYLKVEKIDWANNEDIYIPLFSKDMEVILK